MKLEIHYRTSTGGGGMITIDIDQLSVCPEEGDKILVRGEELEVVRKVWEVVELDSRAYCVQSLQKELLLQIYCEPRAIKIK